jgi:two-component system chemotaxis sensor kinase CheA
MTSESSSSGTDIDLSQFYQAFFEEAGENLEHMERQLLSLDLAAPNDEDLNSIFRCAHSVKGGAAAFSFGEIAALTHEMETLLDKLRRHELTPTPRMVNVLLESGDALRAMLARRQGAGGDPVDTTALLQSIRAAAIGEPRALELRLGPLADLDLADALGAALADVAEIQSIEPLDAGQAADGMRRFAITTTASDAELAELCSFHVAREHVTLMPLEEGYGFHPDAPGAPVEIATVDPGYGFFDDEPAAPVSEPKPAVVVAAPVVPRPSKPMPPVERASAAALEGATLRVPVEKVDQLINLVGELVITQAMLAQNSKDINPRLYQRLAAGLADLDRNTRDLQESVMSIRMIPMSMVFNRFPRMLRDLAAKLGKQVELVTFGEATELDKGLVEKVTDPLTHLVRNSCDHGIESPADRIAKGKPAQGTITLSASHQGSSIVIEVHDNGRGLSRPKLLAKARERGIDAPDSMTDSEVWNLIFAPGFSTAEVLTDVSGRGVGMDVVKKNITSLGGTVEVDSAEGHGMRVSVRLPLTLAIMDGMSVGVAGEVYLLPLSSVVESFQVRPEHTRSIAGTGRVVEVRDEYMPVIDLEQVFSVPRDEGERPPGIMVVVEANGSRVALLVDELLGQQQVVVKNLEANYRKVDNVSGATILGDGRVALLLDVDALIHNSRH